MKDPGAEEARNPTESRGGKEGLLIDHPKSHGHDWAAFKIEPHLLLVLASVLLYTIYWSNLTVARFDALQGHIFDLASGAEPAWLVLHSGWSPYTMWGIFSTHALAFLFAPVEIIPSYPALLWIQSAGLGAAAIAIFGIATIELRSKLAGLLLSEAYLVFFPLGGLNWFDFHYEIFIVPLFLWGYLFYRLERPWPAYVLLALAGLSQFPYAGFTALFAIMNLSWVVRYRSKPIFEFGNRAFWRFDLALLILSTVSLLSGLLFLTSAGSSASVYIHVTSTSSGVTTIGADSRVITILLLFAPFLFLPFASPRWAPFLVPAIGFILFSQDLYWVYPKLDFTQYPAVIIPFAILGTIDSLRRNVIVINMHSQQSTSGLSSAPATTRRYRPRSQAVTSAALILLAVCLVGTTYDPYGPFNSTVSLSYGLPGSITENATIANALNKMIHLIPPSDPNLLLQDNMPQAYPRPLGNNGIILVTGSTVAYNYTYLYERHWLPAKIDYVLTDPWDYTFTYEGDYPYNLSMSAALTHLYAQAQFGVIAEAYGLMLLGRNYSGPIEYYVPTTIQIGAQAMSVTDQTYRAGSLIVAQNVTNSTTIWFGPRATFLQPGLYNITYELRTSNTSSNNRLKLDVSNGGSSLINSTYLYGNDFSEDSTWQNFTNQVYINQFINTLTLGADDVDWSGNIELKGILLNQVGPPSIRFVEGEGPTYNDLYQLARLIPAGSTVVAQPGLSQVLEGDQYISSTQFVWNSSSNPQYLLGDPSWPGYYETGTQSGLSMFDILRSAYAERNYTIRALTQGNSLLTDMRGNGQPLFTPDNSTITPEALSVVYNKYREGALIQATDVTNQSTVWYGPYEYLPPGNYTATFILQTSSLNATSFMKLDVLSGNPLIQQAGLRITGDSFDSVGVWTSFTVNFSLSNFSNNLDFSGDDVEWHGTITLEAIQIQQITL